MKKTRMNFAGLLALSIAVLLLIAAVVCVANVRNTYLDDAAASEVSVWDGTSDTRWYNETDVEFTLTTAQQLAGFATLVNDGNSFEGKTIKLGVDIDLNGRADGATEWILSEDKNSVNSNKLWTPIGTGDVPFLFTFDGQGHTISKMCVVTGNTGGGFIGVVYNSIFTVKNLVFDDCFALSTYNAVGILCGWCEYNWDRYPTRRIPSFENVTVKNSAVCGNSLTGAVLGYVQSSKISNCVAYNNTVYGNYSDSAADIGGFFGKFEDWSNLATFENNSLLKSKMFLPADSSQTGLWGALYGYCTFSNCRTDSAEPVTTSEPDFFLLTNNGYTVGVEEVTFDGENNTSNQFISDSGVIQYCAKSLAPTMVVRFMAPISVTEFKVNGVDSTSYTLDATQTTLTIDSLAESVNDVTVKVSLYDNTLEYRFVTGYKGMPEITKKLDGADITNSPNFLASKDDVFYIINEDNSAGVNVLTVSFAEAISENAKAVITTEKGDELEIAAGQQSATLGNLSSVGSYYEIKYYYMDVLVFSQTYSEFVLLKSLGQDGLYYSEASEYNWQKVSKDDSSNTLGYDYYKSSEDVKGGEDVESIFTVYVVGYKGLSFAFTQSSESNGDYIKIGINGEYPDEYYESSEETDMRKLTWTDVLAEFEDSIINSVTFTYYKDYYNDCGLDQAFVKDLVALAGFDTANVPAGLAYYAVNGVITEKEFANGATVEFLFGDENSANLGVPVLNQGEKCYAYINGERVEQALSEEKGYYYYNLGSFVGTTEVKFIYEREGFVPFGYSVTLDPLVSGTIQDNIVKSDNVTASTDDYENPLVADSTLSTLERIVYRSSNVWVSDSVSGVSFTVSESGILKFEYMISSESRGDKVVYRIGANPITYDDFCISLNYDENTGEYKDDSGNVVCTCLTGNILTSSGEQGWTTVNIPVSVPAGQTTTVHIVYVKDSSDDKGLDIFAIANVEYFADLDVNLTYSVTNAEGGTVSATVDGADTASGSVVNGGSLVKLSAVANDGYRFYGWKNVFTGELILKSTIEFHIVSDVEYQAIIELDGTYVAQGDKGVYNTISAAFVEGKEKTVYVIEDCAINEDLVIPAGVTLILPYSANDATGYAQGGSYARTSWIEGVQPYVTLTVGQSATLTIEGKLIVGGIQHHKSQHAQGHTSGAYSQMVVGGSVVVANGGYLDVIGRVTGGGEITVQNGATVRQPFTVNNYAGGTNTEALYNAEQFPFVQFATINVECKQIVNYGAKMIGSTSLFFWSTIYTQDVVLVDKIENKTSSGEGSLIWLENGSYLEISYNGSKKIDKTVGNIHLGDFGVTTVDVYGSVVAGEFSLQGYGSQKMVLSIPYTYNFNIQNGATVTIAQKYKVMPGAVVTVACGGTINISGNGGLYVYDGLIQAERDGKKYPQAADLAQYGFGKSGMLIVDGVLNIDGIFAGTVQTGGNGIINVGNGATVGEQTIVDSCSTGYQQTSSPNKTIFTMSGRVYGLSGYVQLEKGKKYKAYATDGFVYDAFSVKSADRMSTLSVAMNQTLNGRFLEYDGNNYISDVTFSFPTEFNGKIVVINGVNYEIVDGKVTVDGLTIDGNKKVYYRMSEIESAEVSHEYVVTTGENAFDKLAISVALSEENVYEKVFDSNGGVVSDYVLKAIITYSDGTEVSYDLTFDAFATYVKENAALTSEYISSEVTFAHTLTVVKKELAAYIDSVEALDGAEDIVTDAKSAYAEYRTLTTGLSATELAFVNGKIGSLQDYAKYIVTAIAWKNGVIATYGDTETTADATMIDGSKKENVTVSLGGYDFANGDITATATYAGKYLTVDYTVDAVFGGIARKEVVLTVTGGGKYVYDGTEKKVTVTADGVLAGDEITVEGFGITDVGSKTASFVLGGARAVYYKISDSSVASATITVTAKEVELVWTGSKFTYNGSEQKPEVKFADGEIADGDDVALLVSGNVNVGDYSATATITGSKSANYSLKNPTFEYTIAKKLVTVKVADHNDVSESETSRIVFVAVCEDDLGGYTFIITKDGVEVATVAADGTVALKDGQTLSVGTYKVKAISDNANYEVTSEENEFNIVEPNAYYTVDFGVSEDDKTYDGKATEFNVTAKITDTGEVVDGIVVTITKDGVVVDSVVAAGSYTVIAKVGSDEVEYTKVFVVNKRALKVAIDDISAVYGTPAEVSSELIAGTIVDGDENVYSIAVDGEHVNVGKYNIVGTVNNGNYAVTFVSSKSADRSNGIYTVEKKTVTLVWTGSEFTYDNKAHSPEAKLAEGSVVGNDELIVSVSAGNTDKGNYVATATLGGAANGNYELANATYDYVIEARSITLNVADAESVYGNELSEIKVTPEDVNELCGVLVNEIVRIACKASKTSDVGKYDITLEVINDNFTVNYENGTYTVKKREITVTVAAASSIYGDKLATISGEVTEGSIVNGDENVYSFSKAGESLNVNEYDVVLTVNNDNYTVKYNENVRYTIKAREITVKVSDVDMTYGNTAAGFDYSLEEESSLGYNDNLNSVIDVRREAGDNAGRYAITASGANNNYNVSFVYTDRAKGCSYYVIAKREITIKVKDIEVDSKKTYDEVASEFGCDIVAGTLAGDDTLNVTYAIYFGDRQATADNYATLVRGGIHTVKAIADNANYEITVNDGVFTVTKPKITVKNVGTSFVYDDGKQIKAFDWQKNIEGLLASATESSVVASFRKLVNGTVEGESVAAVTDAGTYRMTIVILHTDAYVFDENAVTEYDITVAKKDISSDIEVVGRTESGTYVQRRGIQIYAKLNEYEDKDLSLNSTFTFNGEAVESPYEVGEYVFTAIIDDANYCGETVYSFRIMTSVAKKIGDLSSLIEGYDAEGASSEKFDAIMAMREITASFTEDDLTQIAEDATYEEVVNQYIALYNNYLNDTKSDVEIAQKVAGNVLFDIMAALTDIAVAFWFGKANRG